MNADRWIFPLALCFVCVLSNDDYFDSNCEYADGCETQSLSALLGSSVLLPCYVSTRSLIDVEWARTPTVHVVNFTSKGQIVFHDHRNGRLKVFPNQHSEGNYSICIDDLKNSDLGCYRCQHVSNCLQVELVAETGAEKDMKLLIYICVGGAAFVLLCVCAYYCMQCLLSCNNRTQDNTINLVGFEGASAQPEEAGRVPVNQQQGGADNLVYENDDQAPAHRQGDPTRNPCNTPGALPYLDRTQNIQSIYPDLNQCNSETVERLPRKQRFHAELFSRLRQASLSRHYYVNQSDLSKQQASSTQAGNHRKGGPGTKKAKENCEYKNPIYNRSTEQLNRL
ncbi:uncharacterized protein LOC123986546 [Micropterus dolomieu]|uniref:uncharacterized protein LOC123986546 n=1 Tax=Micropterus dolomieu TaxID=147949 RepID=UPI001E8E7497|nr:uncharacterized protein LOC123986546 [Micropterus dolomieu]